MIFFNFSKLKVKGVFGSFLIGFLFALSFCPISAALYFGFVIPLAISKSSPFVLPILYGIGTAIPVIIIIALFINFDFKKILSITNITSKFDRYSKLITGWIFIVCGIYLALRYIFEVI